MNELYSNDIIRQQVLISNKTIEKNNYLFCWNGGHSVNIYDAAGNNITCYSIGDFREDKATRQDFINFVEEFSIQDLYQ